MNRITVTARGLELLGDPEEAGPSIQTERGYRDHRSASLINLEVADKNLDLNQALLISLGNKNDPKLGVVTREEIRKKIILRSAGFSENTDIGHGALERGSLNPLVLMSNRMVNALKDPQLTSKLLQKIEQSKESQKTASKRSTNELGDRATSPSKSRLFRLNSNMSQSAFYKPKASETPTPLTRQNSKANVLAPRKPQARLNPDLMVEAELQRRNRLNIEKRLTDVETQAKAHQFYRHRLALLKKEVLSLKHMMESDRSIHDILNYIIKDKVFFSPAEKELIRQKYSPLQLIRLSDYRLTEVISDLSGLQDLLVSKIGNIELELNRMSQVMKKFKLNDNYSHLIQQIGSKIDQHHKHVMEQDHDARELTKSIHDIFKRDFHSDRMQPALNRRNNLEAFSLKAKQQQLMTTGSQFAKSFTKTHGRSSRAATENLSKTGFTYRQRTSATEFPHPSH